MAKEISKTISEDVEFDRKCSKCSHHWVHSEKVEYTVGKEKKWYEDEPEFDLEDMYSHLKKKIKNVKDSFINSAICPKCGALSIDCLGNCFPDGVRSGLATLFSARVKEAIKTIFLIPLLLIILIPMGGYLVTEVMYEDLNNLIDNESLAAIFLGTIGVAILLAFLKVLGNSIYDLFVLQINKPRFNKFIKQSSEIEIEKALSLLIKDNDGVIDTKKIPLKISKYISKFNN